MLLYTKVWKWVLSPESHSFNIIDIYGCSVTSVFFFIDISSTDFLYFYVCISEMKKMVLNGTNSF